MMPGPGPAFQDEPPLLEELGIDFREIGRRTLAVLKVNWQLHVEADLSGPLLFLILYGLFQFLARKFHFGVILCLSTLACLFLYVVFNMLAGTSGNLDFHRCCSVLGYCFVPIVLYSGTAIFYPYGAVRVALAVVAVMWCTRACMSLLAELVPHADEQRSLIAYACALIYTVFALPVVFEGSNR